MEGGAGNETEELDRLLFRLWSIRVGRTTFFRLRGLPTLEAIERDGISNLFLGRELRVPLSWLSYLQMKKLTTGWTYRIRHLFRFSFVKINPTYLEDQRVTRLGDIGFVSAIALFLL